MKDLFTIIDGMYMGPETLGTFPDFRRYEHTVVSLGSLRCVNGGLDLVDCHKLQDLGGLNHVEYWVSLCGCVSLTYYSSLPLHEALNALHTKEVQKVPLYKNILLKSLQGGGIPSL
jgi:hypothetical protein